MIQQGQLWNGLRLYVESSLFTCLSLLAKNACYWDFFQDCSLGSYMIRFLGVLQCYCVFSNLVGVNVPF